MAASQAIFPSARITRFCRSNLHSSLRYPAQFEISSGSGLFPGGAHRTAALI